MHQGESKFGVKTSVIASPSMNPGAVPFFPQRGGRSGAAHNHQRTTDSILTANAEAVRSMGTNSGANATYRSWASVVSGTTRCPAPVAVATPTPNVALPGPASPAVMSEFAAINISADPATAVTPSGPLQGQASSTLASFPNMLGDALGVGHATSDNIHTESVYMCDGSMGGAAHRLCSEFTEGGPRALHEHDMTDNRSGMPRGGHVYVSHVDLSEVSGPQGDDIPLHCGTGSYGGDRGEVAPLLCPHPMGGLTFNTHHVDVTVATPPPLLSGYPRAYWPSSLPNPTWGFATTGPNHYVGTQHPGMPSYAAVHAPASPSRSHFLNVSAVPYHSPYVDTQEICPSATAGYCGNGYPHTAGYTPLAAFSSIGAVHGDSSYPAIGVQSASNWPGPAQCYPSYTQHESRASAYRQSKELVWQRMGVLSSSALAKRHNIRCFIIESEDDWFETVRYHFLKMVSSLRCCYETRNLATAIAPPSEGGVLPPVIHGFMPCGDSGAGRWHTEASLPRATSPSPPTQEALPSEKQEGEELAESSEGQRTFLITGIRPGSIPIVGFDTEWYGKGKVAVVQIASAEYCFVFHLSQYQKSGERCLPEEVIDVLEDPAVLIAGAAIADDAKKLEVEMGIRMTSLVDIQHFAFLFDLCRDGKVGLASLLNSVLLEFIRKNKNISRSNWEWGGVLRIAQRIYAIDDAVASYLLGNHMVALGITDQRFKNLAPLCRGLGCPGCRYAGVSTPTRHLPTSPHYGLGEMTLTDHEVHGLDDPATGMGAFIRDGDGFSPTLRSCSPHGTSEVGDVLPTLPFTCWLTRIAPYAEAAFQRGTHRRARGRPPVAEVSAEQCNVRRAQKGNEE